MFNCRLWGVWEVLNQGMKKQRVYEIICSIAYYSIIVFFIVLIVAASYCAIKLLYPNVEIGSHAELLTAIIALLAFTITLSEYYVKKDSNQAQVLSEYNQRYTEDRNVVKVVKYLNYYDENGAVNNPIPAKPSNYEVEMFMRFFEELNEQIKKNRISEECVYNLFVYYAFKIDKDENLRHQFGVTDEDYSQHWDGFKEITKNYEKYKEAKNH